MIRRLFRRHRPARYTPWATGRQRQAFAIQRQRDGWWWAGPWRWHGATFSQHTKLRWLTATRSSAEAAAEWTLGDKFAGCEIVTVDLPTSDGHQQKARRHLRRV